MGGIEKVLDRAGRARGNVKRSVDQPTVRHPVQKRRAQGSIVGKVIGRLRTTAVRPNQSVGLKNGEPSNSTTRWRTKTGQGRDGNALTLSIELPSVIRALQYGNLSDGPDLAHRKGGTTVRALICEQGRRAIGALP